MAVGLKDVAAKAGVSVKTVSNVINSYPFVKPETRERVQQAVAELGYRPNLSARRLRTGRSELIALSLPEIAMPYFAEMASLIVDAAEQLGWTVLIDRTSGERSHEQRTTAGIRADLIDGSIVSPLSMTPSDIAALRPDHPVVLLGERLARAGADHIAVDNVAAAREATAHLIGLGRVRIAAIGAQPQHSGTSALRLEGYRVALADAGLDASADLVAQGNNFHREDGYTAMQRLLAAERPPDAVFCFNDLLALGCIRAIVEAGLRVPEDVAVVGFDDIEDCRFVTPTLTTVAPDKEFIAVTAVDLLSRRVRGDRSTPPQDVVAQHRLVVRESTVGRTTTG
ncbi:MAG: LacI family transcriptional regulator [Actinomycetota bacterium]|nr:LacI family transcriptional regulator [Actinomycetota bacterium]